ncbi:histidine kinase dimerization/phospho-acceptor domain-containing protein [Pseudoroseomonas wenyumeiae]
MLGRLAASVAHEVRNPLAGMLTALETARRFGDDSEVRSRALDLVERGLRQIEAVVRSTRHLPAGWRTPSLGRGPGRSAPAGHAGGATRPGRAGLARFSAGALPH